MYALTVISVSKLHSSIRIGRLIILLSIGIALIISSTNLAILTESKTGSPVQSSEPHDVLAYVSEEGDLMLHNPVERKATKLLKNVGSFVLSQDGRVAFTKLDQDDRNLYVFDPSTPEVAPISISRELAINDYPLAWSLDGQYLAFASYRDNEERSLYIWNGEFSTNIMPATLLDLAFRFQASWSRDGRLAFTIYHRASDLTTPSEIYLWDGHTTVNLSQNIGGDDRAASWSSTGKLMFGSEREGEYSAYIWDGVSMRNGLPDASSFIRLAPEFDPAYPTWTENGLIGFTNFPDPALPTEKEIIIWDPVTQGVVRRIAVSSKNFYSWLGEGGRIVLSSQLASGIPSVYLDVENLHGEILFSTEIGEFSWSAAGYLAFCGIEDGQSRVLSVWDGAERWVVARVSYKPVKWRNGGLTFSCNNG